MNALWIAGLVIVLLIGLFFALTLCRCAFLADRDVEQFISDLHQASANPTVPEQEG